MAALNADDLALFMRVASLGSFAAAAEGTAMTSSGVSKAISRMEDRLGVTLLQRSTRRLAVTPEGETLLAGAPAVLDAMEQLEAETTAARGRPRGLVRVSAGSAFAQYRIIPGLAAFRARFPEVDIDLQVTDRRVDLLTERVDVAIRTGPLLDSSLVAHKLRSARRLIVASPAYLASRGTPATPADLARHDCLTLSGHDGLARWPFRNGARIETVTIRGAMTADSAEALRAMAIAGLGLVRLADFLLQDAVEDGRLMVLLKDCHADEPLPITALTPPGRARLPRVRAFLDFAAEIMGG
jgi:DNA-binding transcriptional LysR family regulator